MAEHTLDACTEQLNEAMGKPLLQDMELSAQLAKLRYVSDDRPGFTRKKTASGFRYVDTHGKPVKDEKHLARIKSLAIPPAWTKVWICPYANGHLQATGIDAKGRKQYRYHKQWREVRDEAKYEHMIDFGLHLPMIRERVKQDMSKSGLSREKVLAIIIYLLENTMIRVGNDEYAKTNKSYGLTTLRNRHVEVKGGEVKFHFRGKSGVEHSLSLRDAKLARLIRKVKELPGQDLFQYIAEDGSRHAISSSDVNQYLKEITGRDYTAKDFRTWSGTLHTVQALQEMEKSDSESQAKKNVVKAIEAASKKLGNTPAICRKCYVHPLVIETYMAGLLFEKLEAQAEEQGDETALNLIERHVLQLLQQRVEIASANL